MGVSASRDLEEYRNGYPGKVDDPRAVANRRFYQGEIQSRPKGSGGVTIDFWRPIMIKAIRSDPTCQERLITSYKMMLDFYGMQLVDLATGTLARTDNWRDRYRNLNCSGHNYLRITRILKCLGELGFEHLKPGFLEFVMEEVYERGQLPRTKDSLRNYWGPTLRNDADRSRLLAKIEAYEGGGRGCSGDRRAAREARREAERGARESQVRDVELERFKKAKPDPMKAKAAAIEVNIEEEGNKLTETKEAVADPSEDGEATEPLSEEDLEKTEEL